MFAACTLANIIDYQKKHPENLDSSQLTTIIGTSIKRAIRSCQIIYSNGYGGRLSDVEKYFSYVGHSVVNLLQAELNDQQKKFNPDTIADERIPVASPSWSILRQSAEYRLYEIAEQLVQKDVSEVINCFAIEKNKNKRPVWAPVVTFSTSHGGARSDLVVIDRREIESYKAVHKLLCKTIAGAPEKPLNIAVFGPPGSGKSFVVKQLAKSATPPDMRDSLYFETINMAEIPLEKPEKYQDAINKAMSEQKGGKIPVLFFDEFDCSQLRWLKQFLIQMEDWVNPANAKRGSPILIFAGGTSHTYADFTREDGSVTKEQQVAFVMAKGPDFISRLSGHINILGPNRVDDDDDAHVIRRAIFLNAILREKNITAMDSSIIRAMLKVSSFKHGVRSMRAVINMSTQLGGSKIVSSTLPVLPQLNMHVNGKEFLEMIIAESCR